MATKKQKNIQQNVTFTPTLYKKTKWAAENEGISVPEFIRFTIIRYFGNVPSDYVEVLDEKNSEEVGKALDDYKNGRYKEIPNEILKDPEKLHKFLIS